MNKVAGEATNKVADVATNKVADEATMKMADEAAKKMADEAAKKMADEVANVRNVARRMEQMLEISIQKLKVRTMHPTKIYHRSVGKKNK
jgi:hypothetical protein